MFLVVCRMLLVLLVLLGHNRSEAGPRTSWSSIARVTIMEPGCCRAPAILRLSRAMGHGRPATAIKYQPPELEQVRRALNGTNSHPSRSPARIAWHILPHSNQTVNLISD